MSLPSKEKLLEEAYEILGKLSINHYSNDTVEAQSRRAAVLVSIAREVPDTKAKDRPFGDVASL